MKDIINTIIDKFTHIVRDILFYFLSGFIVLAYFYYLFLIKLVEMDNSWIIIILALSLSYAIGQLCMIIYMIIFKFIIEDTKNKTLNNEIKVFKDKENRDAFFQYIERYNNLYHIRGVLFVCFLIICFLGILYIGETYISFLFTSCRCYCYCSIPDNFLVVNIITILSFVISIIFFIGSNNAYKGFKERIDLLNGMSMIYFAYGSNMSLKQMSQRCPNAQFEGVGILENYELCFPIISKKRNNAGVASIRPKTGEFVEGVIYNITDNDLLGLDKFEGQNYYRTIIPIISGKKLMDAWVYIAKDNDADHKVPSKEYMEVIISGAIENNLSGDYIAKLKNIKTI